MIVIINDKQELVNWLDGLQKVALSIEEIKDQDSDLMQWYETIQALYEEILLRYES